MFEASRDEDAEDRPSPMSIQVVSESGHSLSTGSIDRTPCSLISNTHGPDDEGCEDESRRSSAKMGAIDDAGRRPSLPINIYTLDRHGADNLSNSSTRSSEEASGSESDPTASGNASDAYLDRRRGSGSTVDRDVELEVIAPDDVSQNTLVSPSYAFDVVANLMMMVLSPHNSLKIGTSPTPLRVVRMPAYSYAPRERKTTQTIRERACIRT